MAKKAWKDPRGEHTRIYDDILNSPAWAVLSISARVLLNATGVPYSAVVEELKRRTAETGLEEKARRTDA